MNNTVNVVFTDKNGMCIPHTVWSMNDKCIVHGVSDDSFLCCLKETGELIKETNSLSDALSWLQNTQ